MELIILMLAIAPGCFWLWFVYNKDKFDPEPLRMILFAFLLGLGSAGLSVFVESMFRFVGDGVMATVVAPIAEESLKFSLVYLFIFNHKEFDEPVDGIIYASVTALGFATIENVGYLYKYYYEGALFETTIARALLSVPGHFLFSSFWGYGLAVKKFNLPVKNFGQGDIVKTMLVVSIVMHGLFNGLALYHNAAPFLLVFFMMFLWRTFNSRLKRLGSFSPFKETKLKLRKNAIYNTRKEVIRRK